MHDPPCKGRLIQCFMYMRSSPNDNHYAHPLDFVAVVDLNQRKVGAVQHTPAVTLCSACLAAA